MLRNWRRENVTAFGSGTGTDEMIATVTEGVVEIITTDPYVPWQRADAVARHLLPGARIVCRHTRPGYRGYREDWSARTYMAR